jgi:hypothetical protein
MGWCKSSWAGVKAHGAVVKVHELVEKLMGLV